MLQRVAIVRHCMPGAAATGTVAGHQGTIQLGQRGQCLAGGAATYALELANLPPIDAAPGRADRITFDGQTLFVPD